MKIPENYLPIMPYLVLDKAEDFLAFTKKVFNATEQLIVPGNDGRSIMHGEIKIYDAVIMFANSTNTWKEKTAGMFIYVASVDTVYSTAIQNGSASLMPPAKQEYGYSAGFQDPYGNQWWLSQP